MKKCYNNQTNAERLKWLVTMNGIVALWKEKGMTSHDCVFKLRKLYQTKKVGHTGTLDPNVTGVLPICIGNATKMVEFLLESNKAYRGQVCFGFSTTTEDTDGEIVEQKKLIESDYQYIKDKIDTILDGMTGELQQIPPMYSAVKVNGKKLYEYARNNESVERPIRQVTIFDLHRTSEVAFHSDTQTVTVEFEVTCSKGTYIRTLAVDMGVQLGYPAHMSHLERIKSAGFKPEDCVTLSEIEALDIKQREALLKPIEDAFVDIDVFEINPELFERVKNGAVVPKIEALQYPIFFSYQQKIIALYDVHDKDEAYIKPKKMLLGNLN